MMLAENNMILLPLKGITSYRFYHSNLCGRVSDIEQTVHNIIIPDLDARLYDKFKEDLENIVPLKSINEKVIKSLSSPKI